MHAYQKSKHGTFKNIHPTPGREHRGLPASKRFALKLKAGGHDKTCWEWVAGISDDGYPNFHDQGKTFRAHRWIWMHLVSEDLPTHVELDHICMNITCVRPSHLQALDRSRHVQVSRQQKASLKANEDSILVGGNRKPMSIKELSYGVEHGLPSILDGVRVAR
ncbi:HNH endonuclease [Glutamicibacter sp. AOP5-A2-18]|uniref:HNH endonuclease n=1 Tax=Glutamicibacter sp. AOP5-A2-18 TaxID=3457656 RepID=UPI004033652B